MKRGVRIAFVFALLSILFAPRASAQAAPDITCFDLDGAYVVSQEPGPIYLGFFGSQFATESIMNSFGTYGSSFSPLSVRNTFGTYGSSFGSYSAQNRFATSPPAIMKNGMLVGYLTTNTFVMGGIPLAEIDANCTFFATVPSLPGPPPAAPAWVSATDGEFTDAVVVTWAPVSGPVLYVVGYKTVVPDGHFTFLDPVSSTSLRVTGLEPGVVYLFGVATIGPTGDSDPVFDEGNVALPAANRQLTVAKAGTGAGTVTSTPAGISCGGTCSASFTSGTNVTLSASASPGSAFAGWSGGGCSGFGACVVTLNSDTTVTATFNTLPADLNFSLFLPTVRRPQ
jgi:hypothetical protein